MKYPLKGAIHLILFWLLLACNSNTSNIVSVPKFLLNRPFVLFSLTDSITAAVKEPAFPAGFIAASSKWMAVTADSLFFFAVNMTTLQGTSVAFQEWMNYADNNSVKKFFIRGLGKRSICFKSKSGKSWIVFYKGKSIYGVGGKNADSLEIFSRRWLNE